MIGMPEFLSEHPDCAIGGTFVRGFYGSADRVPCRQAEGVTPIIRLNERLNAASDS